MGSRYNTHICIIYDKLCMKNSRCTLDSTICYTRRFYFKRINIKIERVWFGKIYFDFKKGNFLKSLCIINYSKNYLFWKYYISYIYKPLKVENGLSWVWLKYLEGSNFACGRQKRVLYNEVVNFYFLAVNYTCEWLLSFSFVDFI